MLYIAYGSNINNKQMKSRCPKAKFFATGIIQGWKLDFHGVDGTAYATVNRSTNHAVPVVIWELSAADEKIMDQYEGFPISYSKQKIAVYANKKKRFGMIYVMNKKKPIGRPSRKYVNTIRQGYDHFGLDVKILEEALCRNSRDFYAADHMEVREIRKLKKKSLKKKSSWDQFTWSSKDRYYDAQASHYSASWDDVPKDLCDYLANDGDDYWADHPGSRAPSLDDYDLKF